MNDGPTGIQPLYNHEVKMFFEGVNISEVDHGLQVGLSHAVVAGGFVADHQLFLEHME